MNLIKYFKLRNEIKKDKSFLLEKGLEKALNNTSKITLSKENKKLDVTYLIADVAKDYPETAERYLENTEKLRKLSPYFSKI